MLPSEKIGNEFYQSLGKLFYAIAMADNNVRPIEIEKLKEDVQKYWLKVDAIEDEFGTDAGYQIEIVFDWLQQEEKDGGTYFTEFTEFYQEHPSKFSLSIKQLIFKTADDIASSFANKNKSELILLAKLKLLFQKES